MKKLKEGGGREDKEVKTDERKGRMGKRRDGIFIIFNHSVAVIATTLAIFKTQIYHYQFIKRKALHKLARLIATIQRKQRTSIFQTNPSLFDEKNPTDREICCPSSLVTEWSSICTCVLINRDQF